MSYVTLEELKATLEMTGLSFADNDVRMAVNAASGGIDRACNRSFSLGEAGGIRYFTPQSWELCLIDDAVGITKLETGDGDGTFGTTLSENLDFVLEPLNAEADGEPYTRIRAVWNGYFTVAPRSVKATGTWGWPAVPGEIVEATTILATKLLRRAREAPFGVVAIGLDIGSTARIAASDPDVRWLISDFVRERV